MNIFFMLIVSVLFKVNGDFICYVIYCSTGNTYEHKKRFGGINNYQLKHPIPWLFAENGTSKKNKRRLQLQDAFRY